MNYELEQEDNRIQSEFVQLMRNRMDWCVETERYEMAARLRDLIEYETTSDETVKNKYYMYLMEKYAPESYEVLKHKYKTS